MTPWPRNFSLHTTPIKAERNVPVLPKRDGNPSTQGDPDSLKTMGMGGAEQAGPTLFIFSAIIIR